MVKCVIEFEMGVKEKKFEKWKGTDKEIEAGCYQF